MALGEFDLIDRFFLKSGGLRADTRLAIGDDGAIIAPSAGTELAVTVDTLVAGTHFLPDTDPEALGYKSLAVNLSDLAAMGAKPAWATLALTLPSADPAWLEAFARGFFSLAGEHGVDLIGGDTTRGPLSISIQAMGLLRPGQALRRDAARPGDGIYLTGHLGLAGLGLKILLARYDHPCEAALSRLHRPVPRVAAGLALAGLAKSCIDVSDGLAADLGHILSASGTGATLEWTRLPLSSEVREYVHATGDWAMPLSAGEDYELCFTLPEDRENELMGRLSYFGTGCSRIGTIDEAPGLRLLKDGRSVDLPAAGYQHFRN
jgi:thiamine-monophosphate kinase